MEEVDVAKYLVFKKQEEDGPDLRGGYIDALIVHATKCNKKGTSNYCFICYISFLINVKTFFFIFTKP